MNEGGYLSVAYDSFSCVKMLIIAAKGPEMKKFKLTSIIFACLFMIVPLVGLAGEQGANRSPGQYIDDNLIAGQVKGVILGDSGLKGFDVTVTVYKGVVQLSGFVDTQAEKDHAGDRAKNVKGVTEVVNNLIVKK